MEHHDQTKTKPLFKRDIVLVLVVLTVFNKSPHDKDDMDNDDNDVDRDVGSPLQPTKNFRED